MSLKYLIHELKNSVAVIGGFSALALKRSDPQNYLGKINASARHAENLLNDASLLSRLEMRQGSLPLGPVNISALLASSMTSTQADGESKSAQASSTARVSMT